jgi:hypothetical protein
MNLMDLISMKMNMIVLYSVNFLEKSLQKVFEKSLQKVFEKSLQKYARKYVNNVILFFFLVIF